MTSPDETTKTHYICQTYLNAPTAARGANIAQGRQVV
jgi:hypothetical protein